MNKTNLTGNRNLDMKILNRLEDKDLVNVCQVNRMADQICKDQTFWMNRILAKYPNIDPSVFRKYRYDRSWSDYYIHEVRKLSPTVTITSEDFANCGSFSNISGYIGFIIWVGADWDMFDQIMGDLSTFLSYKHTRNRNNRTGRRLAQMVEQIEEPYKSLLENSNYKEVFEMWYQKYKNDLTVDNLITTEVDLTDPNRRLSRSQAGTILKIIQLIREGKIKPDAHWNDTCSILRLNQKYNQ